MFVGRQPKALTSWWYCSRGCVQIGKWIEALYASCELQFILIFDFFFIYFIVCSLFGGVARCVVFVHFNGGFLRCCWFATYCSTLCVNLSLIV
jgi:hypothetical protein